MLVEIIHEYSETPDFYICQYTSLLLLLNGSLESCGNASLLIFRTRRKKCPVVVRHRSWSCVFTLMIIVIQYSRTWSRKNDDFKDFECYQSRSTIIVPSYQQKISRIGLASLANVFSRMVLLFAPSKITSYTTITLGKVVDLPFFKQFPFVHHRSLRASLQSNAQIYTYTVISSDLDCANVFITLLVAVSKTLLRCFRSILLRSTHRRIDSILTTTLTTRKYAKTQPKFDASDG